MLQLQFHQTGSFQEIQQFFISLFVFFGGGFNHRAKRGGSLFQGGSGKEEGSRSNAQVAVGYPSVRRFFMRKLPSTLTDLDETWQK